RIGVHVFGSYEPGRIGSAAYTAQTEPLTLTDSVVNQTTVAANRLAVEGAAADPDRAGTTGDVGAQKTFEIALADKADTGTVGLVVYAQAIAAGDGTDFRFMQFAQRKQRARQSVCGHGREEIGLVLAEVDAAQQLRLRAPAHGARVMAGGNHVSTEALGMLQESVELDFAIAQDVRIGCAPGSVA